MTAGVIGVIALLGTGMVVLSLDTAPADPLEELAAEQLEEVLGDVEPCEPADPPPDADEVREQPFGEDGPPDTLPEDLLAGDGDDGNGVGGLQAVVETTCGRIVFQLYPDEAPQTVNAFTALAEQDYYSGSEIFRNDTTIFALQTGSGDDTNAFDAGFTLPDELGRAQAQGTYGPGDLALANVGQPDTGGAQFFVLYGDSPLPAQYTLFGTAVEGRDVLRRIAAIPTTRDEAAGLESPDVAVYITDVTVEPGPPAPPPPEPEPDAGAGGAQEGGDTAAPQEGPDEGTDATEPAEEPAGSGEDAGGEDG